MAREVLGSVGSTVKPNTLKIGEEIEGYLLRFEASKQFPDNISLIMKGKDGSTFRVASHGNIKYLINDKSLTLGAYTWIKALGPVTIKGKPSTKYEVSQDLDMTTAVAASGFDAIESASTSAGGLTGGGVRKVVEASNAAALKVKTAMGRN